MKSDVPAILLVDDMATLRDLTRDYLQRLGYEVEIAENGREALKILEDRLDEIGLLITDLSMPEMDGMELVARARALRPGLHVIFSSAYGEPDLDPAGISRENTIVLQKPYPLNTLASVIRPIIGPREQKKTA